MRNVWEYPPVKPDQLYNGLKEDADPGARRLVDLLKPNQPSGNSYIDLFAGLLQQYGKRPAKDYAAMLGVEARKFDNALECMTGLTCRDWINEYLRLAACDLLEHTQLNFKEVGQCLGMSSSSFSQFFQAYQHMQPYEYRTLKQHGQRKRFFRI